MRHHKSSVPHLHPQEKGYARSANELMRDVTAISKTGKESRLESSQRPITLLSHIVKLFEHIMLQRLHRHLTPRQEQFGFCSGHFTTLQLARVLHHVAPKHNWGAVSLESF
ncbi:Probable RNA-directed DNA polymerase from transposon X-element [Eumeta japonica]|uniref:Probable RNA-directed DNA polymerase from transposon X-element n=1 Tax=Eumeta variegata TaxID=151549 RepID=A0A4C1UF72_EUMVA|nr:Probable RNA-directed DNA polymerase from transposon X-element [Eumeta japonica]